MRRRARLIIAVAAVMSAGCQITVGGAEDTVSPTPPVVDGTERWDLRRPLTADEAQMPPDVRRRDGTHVDHVTVEPRPVDVVLPSGVELRGPMTSVVLNSVADQFSGTTRPGPSQLIAHTGRLPAADGLSLMRRWLTQLGVSTRSAAVLASAVRVDPPSPVRRDEGAARRIGDVEGQVVGQYRPTDRSVTVVLTVSWGAALDGAE